jgi:hypothetical protein
VTALWSHLLHLVMKGDDGQAADRKEIQEDGECIKGMGLRPLRRSQAVA